MATKPVQPNRAKLNFTRSVQSELYALRDIAAARKRHIKNETAKLDRILASTTNPTIKAYWRGAYAKRLAHEKKGLADVKADYTMIAKRTREYIRKGYVYEWIKFPKI